MKIEEGMYVRTYDGIMKVVELKDNGIMVRFMNEDGNIYFINDLMCNPSYNIIDLIEVGDYVNGEKVKNIEKNNKFAGSVEFEKGFVTEKYIKSIVTKEQFESMEYRI